MAREGRSGGRASLGRLLEELTSYGQAHGWTPATMVRALRSLTMLLSSHPTLADETMDAAAVRAFLVRQRQVALRVVEFLADWSVRYQSLRQVTSHDVAERLDPVGGATRLLVLTAMRSLFATLKTRRVLFANPTAGRGTGKRR